MKYPLEQWDHFIYITLHPGELINTINLGNYTPATWQAPLSEDKNVKICLLQHIATAKKKSHMSACINATHIGCINLSHALSLYIGTVKALPEINDLHRQVLQNYFQLQNKVHEIICFIEENFTSHCNLLSQGTVHLRSCSLGSLGLRFQKCKQILRAHSHDTVLLNIALSSAEKFFSENTLTTSNYIRFLYFKEYVWHLEKISVSLSKEEGVSRQLIQVLLLLNYNRFSFINYLMKNLKEKVNKIDSPYEKIRQWHIYLRDFKQLQHLPRYALFVNAPSLKKIIVRNIKEEINFLKSKEKIKGTAVPSCANILQPTEEPLLTSLSVAQLALFVRLLVDVGIIETKNQLSLLKKIAAVMRTRKTVSISDESLRSKFYAPQTTAAIIIKEYLLNMMNKLRSY